MPIMVLNESGTQLLSVRNIVTDGNSLWGDVELDGIKCRVPLVKFNSKKEAKRMLERLILEISANPNMPIDMGLLKMASEMVAKHAEANS